MHWQYLSPTPAGKWIELRPTVITKALGQNSQTTRTSSFRTVWCNTKNRITRRECDANWVFMVLKLWCSEWGARSHSQVGLRPRRLRFDNISAAIIIFSSSLRTSTFFGFGKSFKKTKTVLMLRERKIWHITTQQERTCSTGIIRNNPFPPNLFILAYNYPARENMFNRYHSEQSLSSKSLHFGIQCNQFFLFKTLFEKIIHLCWSNRLQTLYDHSSGVTFLPEWFIFANFFSLQRFS